MSEEAIVEASTQTPVQSVTLDQLINIALEQDASGIHFSQEGRVALRVEGRFVFVENVDQLSAQVVEEMVNQMLSDEVQLKRLKTVRELDFSYTHSNGVNFRVNAFYARGNLSVVMRLTSRHVPRMEELGLPEVTKSLLNLSEGLILVTGSAGSGKSTTIQSMLEFLNQNFSHHIITIENPIEYLFKSQKSIISQRELGKDTLSFVNAIQSSSREDPNVVMVSEIRDKETLNAMISLVEMGHLVIGAIPTKNTRQTIDQILSLYSPDEHAVMLDRLADALSAILSQDLIDRADQTGRIAIFELLIGTKGVKNIVRHNMLNQLRTAMESGSAMGMVTMDAYAMQLVERGYISQESAGPYLEQVN